MKRLIFAASCAMIAYCVLASCPAFAHDMHGAAHIHDLSVITGIVSAYIAAALAYLLGLLK